MYGAMGLGHMSELYAGRVDRCDMAEAEGHAEQSRLLAWEELLAAGIMTEALKPVTDYAFDVLGFEKLVLANAVGNCASRRIKENIGAVFLRTEPAVYVNPDYTEREVWELTKERWKVFKLRPLSH